MKSKIKSEGNQAFNVPNTPEGLLFIKQLRKFSNKKKNNEFRAKGRGTRILYAQKVGKYNARTGISKEFATWFAVYMNSNASYRQRLISEQYGKIKNLEEANVLLSSKIKEYETTMLTPMVTNENDLKDLKAQIAWYQERNAELVLKVNPPINILENEITRLKAEAEVRTQKSSKTIKELEAEIVRLVDNLSHYRNESEKYFNENGNLKQKIEGYERRENIMKNQVKADSLPQGITINIPKGSIINIVDK